MASIEEVVTAEAGKTVASKTWIRQTASSVARASGAEENAGNFLTGTQGNTPKGDA
jgi:hypothetical protein